MFANWIVVLILLIAAFAVADQPLKEKEAKSRMRRCARQFNIAMSFQCRGITEEECEPFRELFDLETSNMSVVRERLLERKCCERRCSLQVLRSLCCFK